MKKFNFRLFSLISLTFVGATALTVSIVSGKKSISNDGAGDPGYNIVLDDSNTPTFEDEYQKEVGPETVFEKGNYALNMKYRLAKYEDGYHVNLAPHGLMYNEVDNSTNKNKITSLSSITVNYTSTSNMTVKTSLRNDGKEFGAAQAVTDGTPVEFQDNPYYFILEAGDAAAQIESVVLNYSCEANDDYQLSTLSGTYTGTGTDGYTYKLTLNGSSATIASLDKASNQTVSGTAEIVDGNKIQCTLAIGGTYTNSISEDHRVLTFSAKSGNASAFPEINFYKVYQVENFESYSATGNAFGGSGRGADSLFSMSGLRAAYHSDWYTSSSSYAVSYLGDSGWKVMGSTDFLTYTSNKGYNNSKAAAFKGNSNGLRYIQMKGMFGTPEIIGKGAYLSFYAKAYSNSSLSTVKTTDTAVKVYGFYGQQILKTNLSSIRTSVDLTIPANSDWARYTIPLDDSKNYYSFGFYLNTSANVYMVVDNVEIYTVNPYAEYVAPVNVTGISVSPTELELEVGQNSTVTATVTPNDATNKTVVWTTSNSSVATVNDGAVSAIGAGNATITATTQDGGYTATCAVTVTSPSAAPYPTGSYKGTATVGGSDFAIVIALGNRTNGLVAVRLANKDAVATGITYNDSTQQFTIATTGDYNGASFGNITGTYDDGNDRLTNISCSGTVSSYVSNNGSITATKLDVWDCDGTTSQLQSIFLRRYMSGSWQKDNSKADRITSNTEQFVSGTGSVKRRGYSGGAVALNFQNDFSPAKKVQNVQFWVYNPSGSDIVLRMWYYQAASFGSNGETGTVTAKAGQWTYVAMGFGSGSGDGNRTIYNFQIADFNNTGAYLSFDNIALF